MDDTLQRWARVLFWPIAKCLEATGLKSASDENRPAPSSSPSLSRSQGRPVSFADAPARISSSRQAGADVLGTPAAPPTPAPQTPEPTASGPAANTTPAADAKLSPIAASAEEVSVVEAAPALTAQPAQPQELHQQQEQQTAPATPPRVSFTEPPASGSKHQHPEASPRDQAQRAQKKRRSAGESGEIPVPVVEPETSEPTAAEEVEVNAPEAAAPGPAAAAPPPEGTGESSSRMASMNPGTNNGQTGGKGNKRGGKNRKRKSKK